MTISGRNLIEINRIARKQAEAFFASQVQSVEYGLSMVDARGVSEFMFSGEICSMVWEATFQIAWSA